MTNLSTFNHDGANRQAQAVLALVQLYLGDGIESSWNDKYKCYDAQIQVGRWENCREQGYVLYLRSKDYKKQLNIAFFEHRNSDGIHALKWEQITTNSPNIDSAVFGDYCYSDKFDTSFSVPYTEVVTMAEWVFQEFEKFWTETKTILDN